jgi:hypothetical protein
VDHQLIALYEIKRQSFLIGYIQSPERFTDALAFAHYNRVAPIFHEGIMRESYESDPFEEVYQVSAAFVSEVTKYIDDRWLAKDYEAMEFYKLEDKFGGYKANRVELIHALEYTRISGRFDDTVWAAIESNAPVEANSLDATFSQKDVYFD